VAYGGVRKVLPYALPYGRENCVSTFGQATRERVRGAFIYTRDPKVRLFSAVTHHDTHISNLWLWHLTPDLEC